MKKILIIVLVVLAIIGVGIFGYVYYLNNNPNNTTASQVNIGSGPAVTLPSTTNPNLVSVSLKGVSYHNIPLDGYSIINPTKFEPDQLATTDGKTFPIIDIPTEPTIKDTALASLLPGKSVAGNSDLTGKPNAQIILSDNATIASNTLVIYVQKDATSIHFTLAWKVIAREGMSSWTIYFDAMTGAMLYNRNNAIS